jgi:hypothetical protein
LLAQGLQVLDTSDAMRIVPRWFPLSGRTTTRRIVSVLAVAITARAGAMDAQVQHLPRRGARPVVQRPTGGWQLESNATVDLWYHGLAVIGVTQQGSLPLYSAAYASRVREEKERLGIYPTKLDELGEEIGRAIESDEALSLLHFAPLYFHAADPLEMLRALGAVADRRAGDVAVANPRVRFGAIVMTQTLQTAGQRRVVGKLVEAMEDEYAVFFQEFRERHRAEHSDQLADLDRRWTYGLALDLADFLKRSGIESGVLIPSPALGPEGRLFQGDPLSDQTRLIAVWMPLDGGVDAPLYGAARELGFTAVDRVVDPERYDPSELEDVRASAAVRFGAMLLEFYAPAQLSGYRRAYIEAAGHESAGRGTAAAFEQTFPLDAEVLSLLRREIRRR